MTERNGGLPEGVEFVAEEEGVREFRLANGLKLLLVENRVAPVATFLVLYRVGSRNEAVGHTGATHLLEHMLFKGTERRPDPKQISEEIEGVGGVLNAATSREGTSYWFKAPSSHFSAGYDVLADIVRNSMVDCT